MPAFAIKRFTIDNVAPTAIIAPINCDHVFLETETYGYDLWSTLGDATTRARRLAGTAQSISGQSPSRNLVRSRFRAGDIVGYVQSLGASDALVGNFIGAFE